MHTITHYPGGPAEPCPTLDVDTVIGVMSIALLCAWLMLIWGAAYFSCPSL